MSTVPLNYTIDDGASTTKTLFSNTPQTLDARVARLSQDAIDLSIPPKAFSFANGRPAGEEWWLASTGGYDLEQARYTSHAALARLIRSFIANRVSDGVHLRVAVGVNTQVNDKQMREVAKLLQGEQTYHTTSGNARTVYVDDVVVEHQGKAAARHVLKDYRVENIVVVDGGFFTTDFVGYEVKTGKPPIQRSALNVGVSTFLRSFSSAYASHHGTFADEPLHVWNERLVAGAFADKADRKLLQAALSETFAVPIADKVARARERADGDRPVVVVTGGLGALMQAYGLSLDIPDAKETHYRQGVYDVVRGLELSLK